MEAAILWTKHVRCKDNGERPVSDGGQSNDRHRSIDRLDWADRNPAIATSKQTLPCSPTVAESKKSSSMARQQGEEGVSEMTPEAASGADGRSVRVPEAGETQAKNTANSCLVY